MNSLSLILERDEDTEPLQFSVKRIVNAGYVGRDKSVVQAHIDELALEGVPAPKSVPLVFPVLSRSITTGKSLEVLGEKTNGEAEFVVLIQNGRIFIGVGSDHTDRELETVSISMSKQIHENVISKKIWELTEIVDHWDDLELRSWMKFNGSSEEILYQDAKLGTIISAKDLVDLVASRMKDTSLDGMVIFSGTIPIVTEKMAFGNYFRCELTDPIKDRVLICEYNIERLEYLRDE